MSGEFHRFDGLTLAASQSYSTPDRVQFYMSGGVFTGSKLLTPAQARALADSLMTAAHAAERVAALAATGELAA